MPRRPGSRPPVPQPLSRGVRALLAALAVALVAPVAGAQSVPEAAADAAPASGWNARLLLGGGAGIYRAERPHPDYAGLVGVELSRPGLLGERVRLRADYVVGYRRGGVFGQFHDCDGCSGLIQGGALSAIVMPMPRARVRPYLIAGYGIYRYRTDAGPAGRHDGVDASVNLGLGVEAAVTEQAELFLELRSIPAGGGMIPAVGGLRLRF